MERAFMSAFGEEQTAAVPHGRDRTFPLSRFIFAMKFSRALCAKVSKGRVSTLGRVFGLDPSCLGGCLFSAFTGTSSDWLSRFAARWRFGLGSYRSATVADFHDLPRCLEFLRKERRTARPSLPARFSASVNGVHFLPSAAHWSGDHLMRSNLHSRFARKIFACQANIIIS